jgi:hypothetical protein
LGSRVACEAVVQGGVAARILFAAGQVTFGTNVADLLLAFERIDRVMEPYRVHTQDAVSLNLYGTSRAVADQAKSLVGATPATSIFIEGLPSQDATLSVEAAVPLK